MEKITIAPLVLEWERRARRKFFDAAREKDPMGKKLIEHGAMCYFNCSQELRRLAGLPQLAGAANLLEGQK